MGAYRERVRQQARETDREAARVEAESVRRRTPVVPDTVREQGVIASPVSKAAEEAVEVEAVETG
jgi:hypothetical protein